MADSYRPYTPDTWPEPRSAIVYPDALQAAHLRRRKFNAAEFYRMVPACILGEDTLEELIDGDVMVRAYQTPRHSRALSRLLRRFAVDPAPGLNVQTPIPIRLDDYNEPVADVALLSPGYAGPEPPGPQDALLAIEIADTPAETEYDERVKLPLYAGYGLPELWLVKLPSMLIESHRAPVGGRYREVASFGPGETIAPLALPAVPVAVNEILR